MADSALELDDFLSRFQLLRPQPTRSAAAISVASLLSTAPPGKAT